MINQISINSSNTIQLSRAQLLSWLNELVNANITKIQQLGTGAIYCQLLDILYPGKVQLNKVNFKAKNDYQYINNFKILQQFFTKFGVMKNIQVQKLIKCKYQDNLEFLQWFKKIFDTHYVGNKDSDIMFKKSASQCQFQVGQQKQNKKPSRALNFDEMQKSSNISELLNLPLGKEGGSQRQSVSSTSRNNERKGRQNDGMKSCTERINIIQKKMVAIQNEQFEQTRNALNKSQMRVQKAIEKQKQPYYSPSKLMLKQNFYKTSQSSQKLINEQKQFYMKKFKEMEHVLELWEGKEQCSELIGEIRKILFITSEVKEWGVDEETRKVVIADGHSPNTVQKIAQTIQIPAVQQAHQSTKFQQE